MLQPRPKIEAFPRGAEVLEALGLEAASLPVELYDNGPRHVLVALDDVERLRALRPDLGRLARAHEGTIAVFAPCGRGLEARVFVPALGVSEDPATGSAAGPLALHAARHGWAGAGEFVEIAQGEAIGRPSRLLARVTGPVDAPETVEVEGDVVIVGRGELRLPIFG
jgi:trans-2,3-dihydro-3-hydroxyanthranilate isomerase